MTSHDRNLLNLGPLNLAVLLKLYFLEILGYKYTFLLLYLIPVFLNSLEKPQNIHFTFLKWLVSNLLFFRTRDIDHW